MTITAIELVEESPTTIISLPSILGKIHEDQVTINLMLTMQCNFSCDHCFFASGPHEEKGYMSDDMLRKVFRFCDKILDDCLATNVCLNLIGGEPTLNMNEFERCFNACARYVYDDRNGYKIELTMSTNGWWLQEMKHTIRFMEIVHRYVNSDGTADGWLSVRISDTIWHAAQRKKWDKGKYIKNKLVDLFENSDPEFNLYYEIEGWECEGCGDFFQELVEECPGCGCQDFMPVERERPDMPPPPHPGSPWIYADQWSDEDHVIPSHPERGQFGGNDLGRSHGREGCGTHMIATFRPNGTIQDACCRGSNMPFATIDDHPIVVFGINNSFLLDNKPSCRDCHYAARRWKGGKEEQNARAYFEALIPTLEVVDDNGEPGIMWTDPLTKESFLWNPR